MMIILTVPSLTPQRIIKQDYKIRGQTEVSVALSYNSRMAVIGRKNAQCAIYGGTSEQPITSVSLFVYR